MFDWSVQNNIYLLPDNRRRIPDIARYPKTLPDNPTYRISGTALNSAVMLNNSITSNGKVVVNNGSKTTL